MDTFIRHTRGLRCIMKGSLYYNKSYIIPYKNIMFISLYSGVVIHPYNKKSVIHKSTLSGIETYNDKLIIPVRVSYILAD